jgi:hypothetical protein
MEERGRITFGKKEGKKCCFLGTECWREFRLGKRRGERGGAEQ